MSLRVRVARATPPGQLIVLGVHLQTSWERPG